MMKIKEMQIVFENFEILKIPYQYVGQMKLDYITDSIIKVNNLNKEDNVTEYKFANSAFICIDSKFNKVEYSDTLFNKQQLPFDRINEYNDISCIDLIEENDIQHSYYMAYDGLENNSLQKNEIISNGDMVIRINKNH